MPPKDHTLFCAKSKVQLKQLIFTGIVDNDLCEPNWLVVTSKDHFPIELRNGEKIQRSDMGASDEETDNLIIQQVHHIIQKGIV